MIWTSLDRCTYTKLVLWQFCLTHRKLSRQKIHARAIVSADKKLQNDFNPFPNKPWFLRVCRINLLKTCGKRAISPFPSVFSTHMDNFLPFSSKLKLSSANSFSLEKSKICCMGES